MLVYIWMKMMNNDFSRKDRDLLVEANTILKELKKDFDNHLQDHKKYMYLALSTAIGAIITLAICIIKLV